MNDSVQIHYLTGVLKLEPIKYHLKELKIARWWQGYRSEYQIVSEFMSLGGFNSSEEAHSAAREMGFVLTTGR